MILSLGGAISFMTNLKPILLFYLNPTQVITKPWFLLLFPLGWFITFAVADVMCNLFYHRSGGELSLINGTAFAMVPLLLVPGLILLVPPFSAVIQSATALSIPSLFGVQVCVVSL